MGEKDISALVTVAHHKVEFDSEMGSVLTIKNCVIDLLGYSEKPVFDCREKGVIVNLEYWRMYPLSHTLEWREIWGHIKSRLYLGRQRIKRKVCRAARRLIHG